MGLKFYKNLMPLLPANSSRYRAVIAENVVVISWSTFRKLEGILEKAHNAFDLKDSLPSGSVVSQYRSSCAR